MLNGNFFERVKHETSGENSFRVPLLQTVTEGDPNRSNSWFDDTDMSDGSAGENETREWSQRQKLMASDRDEDRTEDEDGSRSDRPDDIAADEMDYGARFGWSLATDGDTAVVGAPWEDDPNGTQAGAAYVFTRSDGAWRQQAKLAPDDGDIRDYFGRSVAIDGGTVLIGAPGSENAGRNRGGLAYVFIRSGENWSQQAKLIPDDSGADVRFGNSVAVDGDAALIGAHYDDDPNGFHGGSAYVFVRSDGTWHQEAKLFADDGCEHGRFGQAVAIEGHTVLVGARASDTSTGARTGSVYVFIRSTGIWFQQAKLAPDDEDRGGNFGVSVDLDGTAAVIGARSAENSAGCVTGAAYVFDRSADGWTQQAKLVPDDGDDGDRFGWAVGLDGEFAVVGARYDNDPHGDRSGSAYLFTRSDGTWRQHTKLAPADGNEGDAFGNSVAVEGVTVLIGATFDRGPEGDSAGSAYVFEPSSE